MLILADSTQKDFNIFGVSLLPLAISPSPPASRLLRQLPHQNVAILYLKNGMEHK